MPGRWLLLLSLAVGFTAAAQEGAEEAASAPGAEDSEPRQSETSPEEDTQAGGVKTLSGMSILGNEEAPKSLVIVPWKSSQIGDGLGVANLIDERARPVDKEVFMREVHYYELRSGTQE